MKLLADFTTPKQAFDAGDGRVERAFFVFLSSWLRSHNCHLDTRYAKNLARKAG